MLLLLAVASAVGAAEQLGHLHLANLQERQRSCSSSSSSSNTWSCCRKALRGSSCLLPSLSVTVMLALTGTAGAPAAMGG